MGGKPAILTSNFLKKSVDAATQDYFSSQRIRDESAKKKISPVLDTDSAVDQYLRLQA